MRTKFVKWTSGLIAAALGAVSALAAPAVHKIETRTAGDAAQVAAAGGVMIADYGAFKLYQTESVPPGLSGSAEVRDNYNSILLNAAPLDTSLPATQSARHADASFAGKRMHLVQFAGPVKPEWRRELVAAGVEIVSYIPHNAYLVYGDSSAIGQLQKLAAAAHYQWDGPYLDNYKIHPGAAQAGAGRFGIQLMADAAANADTLKLIAQLKTRPEGHSRPVLNYVDVTAWLDPADLAKIAARPDVVSIHRLGVARPEGERQDQIAAGALSGNGPSGPGYLAWLTKLGFASSPFNFVVDLTDGGIDNGTANPNHFGLYTNGVITEGSRVVYNVLGGTANSPGGVLAGCAGHGNLNAHIIMGYDNGTGFPYADSAGYHFGLGVCPFVRIGSTVIFDPDYSTDFDDTAVISTAYGNGARISNNSWGDDNVTENGVYNTDAMEYDALVRDAEPAGAASAQPGNQEMVIVFAAGNNGPYAGSISPPGTAKNVITVGGGQNVQPFGAADSSGVGNSQSDNANSIISFSSRGPCFDGRSKPDLVAPASHVSGGVPQANNPGSNGTASPCFLADASEISGGPGTNLFYPVNQQFYTCSSGTSHATPCVTGACALLRQYFLNHSLTGTNPPSAAMTKAYLMNSARYMTGAGADDTLWSQNQGMGELNLGLAFDGAPRLLHDELASDLFTATGQSRQLTGVVGDTTKPFRVTLAWTDAPGSTSGNSFNNDLDLTVTVGGVTYKGNNFSGSNSVAGGVADSINNVESVFLPAGVSGPFTITVTAANINSVGVPNASSNLSQDFALVAYNVGASAEFAAAGYTLAPNERCGTNALYPGETITVNLAVQNSGNLATTNLTGTLVPALYEQGLDATGAPVSVGQLAAFIAGNSIATPGPAQSFGVVQPGAIAAMPFTFFADSSCGQTIPVELQLSDGSNNLGVVEYEIQLGLPVFDTVLSNSFDNIQPGALPAGWAASVSSTQLTNWAVEAGVYASPSNAFYCPDASIAGAADLYSPVFTLPAGTNQLSFASQFNLEANYDGGVLEISINSNAFVDVTAAGGTFLSGGYTGTITDNQDAAMGIPLNPLLGRSAWTGTNAGFEPTVVQLPAFSAPTPVQFRWVCGTDGANNNLVGTGGWWIDDVVAGQPSFECNGCPPALYASIVILTPSNGLVRTSTSPVLEVAGFAPPGAALVVSNNGASNAAAMSDYYGVFAAAVALQFGSNYITVSSPTNAAASVSVVVDIAPPTFQVPAVVNSNFLVSGQGAPGATIDVYTNSTNSAPVAVFIAGTNGVFSGIVSASLGTNFLYVTQTADGQTSPVLVAGPINVVALTPPVFVVPVYGQAVSNAVFTVRGKSAPGASVVIYDRTPTTTNRATNTVATKTGTFSVPVRLANGTNWLYATQTTGGVTSPYSPETLVIDYLSPVILVQPANQTNFLGGTVTFTAVATGAPPLTQFWETNGARVPGSSGPVLVVPNLKTNNEAAYVFVASNSYGVAYSATASLTLVANPYTNLAGAYYGLFAETNAKFNSSGLVTLNVTTGGHFTGRILNAGAGYPFSGALSGVGWSSNVVPRGAALPPLTVVMNLNVSNSPGRILGTVKAGTNWQAGLEINESAYSSAHPFTNLGTYTMSFGAGSNGPNGNGFATVNIASNGLVTLNGLLPGNVAVTPSAVGLSASGRWPLYAPLYGASGALAGWLYFTNLAPDVVAPANLVPSALGGSNVAWFHTGPGTPGFPLGFTNEELAAGSTYSPAGNAAIVATTNLEVVLEGGGLSTPLTNAVTLSNTGAVVAKGKGIPGLVLSLNRTKGTLSGSFQAGAGTVIAIQGVLLQDQTNAAGYFNGPSGPGAFYLTP